MPNARDEAGNIWQVDAQGNPVRLVQPAAPQMPANPAFPYQGPQAAANVQKTTTETATDQAGLPYVAPKAAADVRKANAEAATAEAAAKKAQGDNADKTQALMDTTRQLVQGVERARPLVNGWSTGGMGWIGQQLPLSTQANQLDTVINQQVKGNIFQNWVAQLKAQSDNGSTGVGRVLQSEIPLVTGAAGALDPVKLGQAGTIQSLDQIEGGAVRVAAERNGENPDDPAVVAKYRHMFGLPPLAGGGNGAPPLAPGSGGGAPPATPFDNNPGGGQTVATGGVRNIFDPTVAAGLNGLVQQGRPYSEAAAYTQQHGYPAPSPQQYAAAIAWQKAHTNSRYDAANPIREVPTTTFQRFTASPVGAAIAAAANSGGFGVPSLLAPKQYSDLTNTQPIPSIIGDVAGGVTGTSLMGKGLGAVAGAIDNPLLAKTVASPLAANLAYGSAYGATQGGLPGAVAGAGGALVGHGVGRLAEGAFPSVFETKALQAAKASTPTISQLKSQANDLYTAAEANGVAAAPQDTQDLAHAFQGILAGEGRISPSGRLSEVHPKVKEAYQLVQDYAGAPMTPTQMQTVRSVIGEGLSSDDAAERRTARLLLDNFDQWTAAKVPGLDQARSVASRYLQAQQIQKAQDLAQANAGYYTGSGYENALRNQFRQLDRNAIKGAVNFNPALTDAVETTSRGTPLSNAARHLGKFAPTGVVPVALDASIAEAGHPGYSLLGGALMGAGALGRRAATNMTARNAEIANMIARGGPEFGDILKNLLAESSARASRIGAGLFGAPAAIPFSQ